MNVQFIATIYGTKRSGIMHALAEKTHQLDGLWLNSKVNQMGGQFIALIKIDIPKENVDELKRFFSSQQGCTSVFNEVVQLSEGTKLMNLTFESKDRYGLVQDISNVLQQKYIDIDKMDANRVAVADLGQSMFSASFDLHVPVDCDLEALKHCLNQVDEHAIIHLH
ncbi:glycine cleavage system protein R [Thalassotalea aquiviva]|uniref:glycine cleavage system protein R n=1 Tax=Thalassotalea aquiviva TaxID=3242415 RepID=UPI00352AAE12